MAVFSAIASAVISIFGSILSYVSSRKTNQSNDEINQGNLDYNKALTLKQWERDDTAHQREVADLEAAGLSPLAASGSGAMNSQAIGAPSALAMQAPQIDLNALSQSILGMAQINENKRHNMAIEKYESGRLENEAAQIEIKAKELDIENKKVEETIKHNAALIKLQSQEIDEKIRSNKKGEELRLSEIEERKFEEESQRMVKEIQRQAGGADIKTEVIYDFDIYSKRMQLWSIQFSNFIDMLSETRSAQGSSKSGNGSIGVNAPTPTPGYMSLAGNLSAGGSTSQHTYSDVSKRQEAMLKKFYAEYPIPVYINKNDYKRVFN